MNKDSLSLLALFAIFFLAAPLAAVGEDGGAAHQGNPDRAKAWFQSHDANADGLICPNETDLPDAFFARADQNGDGCLSGQEAGMGARRAGGGQNDPWQMFQRLDANQDGMVCRDELPDGPPERMGEGGRPGRGQGGQHSPRRGEGREDGQGGQQGTGPGGQHRGPGMDGRPGGPDGQHRGPGMDGRPGARQSPHEWLRRLDKNGDGCISRDEVPQGGSGGQNQGNVWNRLRQLDANHDGKVCRDEILASMDGAGRERLEQLFLQADADHDGCLTASETAHLRAPGQGDDMPRGDRAANFILRHDSNGDGQVTADEFPGPPELFARLDKDGDGILTAADFDS
ncbi:hypothetical protein IIA16_01520 [bacterium]|nr:hypothetical protein [bacterium]